MKHSHLVGFLETICQGLELSQTRLHEAEKRSQGVGNWLAASDDPDLQALDIYFQGSTAIGTTVKPFGRNEHDVDLVAHDPIGTRQLSPSMLMQKIGDRLKSNGNYEPLLEAKNRCWRLVYANEFHLDITPSIPNPWCVSGGELVPDRKARNWKASNPWSYRKLFERRAALSPRLLAVAFDTLAKAEVEAFPEQSKFKGILRRCVQLLKRHRDVHFDGPHRELAPISILITTLASQSYERAVNAGAYQTELQFLLAVIRGMPDFICRRDEDGRIVWEVPNETTVGENFAERWNQDPKLPEAFYVWHKKALSDLEALASLQGVDVIGLRLGDAFGESAANRAIGALTDQISSARGHGALGIVPAIGLVIKPSVVAASIRPNTFFGRS